MNRVGSLLGWLLLAALLVALFWGLGYLPARHPGMLTGSEECLAAYRRARTAVDSAIVDAQRPVLLREKSPNAMNCGALRRSGHLRHAPSAPPPNDSLHVTGARTMEVISYEWLASVPRIQHRVARRFVART